MRGGSPVKTGLVDTPRKRTLGDLTECQEGEPFRTVVDARTSKSAGRVKGHSR
jgi:hypothetical protein